MIPAEPYLKAAGVDLALQMTAALLPAAAAMKAEQLTDAALMREVEKDGRGNF